MAEKNINFIGKRILPRTFCIFAVNHMLDGVTCRDVACYVPTRFVIDNLFYISIDNYLLQNPFAQGYLIIGPSD
jgi:hypothetical protein